MYAVHPQPQPLTNMPVTATECVMVFLCVHDSSVCLPLPLAGPIVSRSLVAQVLLPYACGNKPWTRPLRRAQARATTAAPRPEPCSWIRPGACAAVRVRCLKAGCPVRALQELRHACDFCDWVTLRGARDAP